MNIVKLELSERHKLLQDLVKNRSYVFGTMDDNRVLIFLNNLCDVLESGIEGDIVELGCYMGKTSILISQILKIYKSDKKFYVFDSFEGLPERCEHDTTITKHVPDWAKKSSLSSSIDVFINLYKEYQLDLPIINKGFFSEIHDDLYPKKIAIALLDGDLYTSIYDSLEKVFFNVVPNGIIHVDDYEHPDLPGVKKACDDYLEKNNITDKFIINLEEDKVY
jgi:O-methyltransferase